MSQDTPKLSFNAALSRVRIEFTKAHTQESENPPEDLIQRAKTKMESLKEQGVFAFFVVYEERLKLFWKAMRQRVCHPETKVSCTLAAGAPNLSGIKVGKSSDAKAGALLSIDASAKIMSSWRFEWIKLVVSKELKSQGIRSILNPAHINSAFLKARSGEKIVNYPLGLMPSLKVNSNSDEKPYTLMGNPGRRELIVVINEPLRIDQEMLNALFSNASLATRKMMAPNIEYKFLKDEISQAISLAQEGPESCGLDLPSVQLLGVGLLKASTIQQQNYKTQNLSAPKGVKPQKPPSGSGAAHLSILISEDGLEAKISHFDMALYDDPYLTLDLQFLQQEAKEAGVKFGASDDILKPVLEAIERKEDLTGKIVALGEQGLGGKQPYLHATYKDMPEMSENELASANIDIREMQQRNLVQRGKLVAEIRFIVPPKYGRTVKDEPILPPMGEETEINIGEGIQRKGAKFFATTAGIPLIEGTNISLNKALIHEGDVNLKTGNIRFDGPAEIHGSIDIGAVVEVTGDLVVQGGIRGGIVRSGGEITVSGGIISGEHGRVQSRGDIRCDFIENSTVVCGGSLFVGKSILNSKIIASGCVELADSKGIVIGGTLSCREYLRTGNLGLSRGAATILNIGVDPRSELAVQIRSARLEKVKAKNNEDRQALRELTRKNASQMTQRHEEMKLKLQYRLQKARLIMDRLQAHLDQAKSMLNYDPDSKIYISELLSTNCKVMVGGVVIPVVHEVVGVALCAKRQNGSHIVSIEECALRERKQESSGKKAS